MKTLKRSDVVKTYGVTRTTVKRWIDQAKLGKNNLILVEKNGKDFILDNEHNKIIIKKFVENGRKYDPSSPQKHVKPKKELYEIFNTEELAEIINCLENYSEIPNKFTYMNGGAEEWHKYAKNSVIRSIINPVTNTIEVLDSIYYFLENFIEKKQKFNVFDIGVGDLTPVKDFIRKLIKRERINKYIGLDFSQEMLNIANQKFTEEFKEKDIKYDMIKVDINKDNLIKLLFYESNRKENKFKTKNLLLFLGSTIENERDKIGTMINIRNSMSLEDILIIGETIDSESSKSYFNFNLSDKPKTKLEKISKRDKWVLETFGIQEDFYDVKMYYDDEDKSRYTKIYPFFDIFIEISSEDFDKVIFLPKNKPIILWRHSHQSIRQIIETLDSVGLKPINFSTSKDESQVILTCKLKEIN